MKAIKAILILSFLLTSTIYSLAQDTIFINKWGGKTTRGNASFLRVYTPETDMFLVEDFYPSGEIQMRGHSLYRDSLVRMGLFKYYSKEGIITEEGNYKKSKKVGEWKTYQQEGILKTVHTYNPEGKLEGPFLVYYPDGSLKRKDRYKDDEVVDKKCFGIDGSDTTWFEFMTIPIYKGGDQARIDFLIKNVVYPQYAREAGIQGTVYVNFTVLKNGKLSNINIIRGVHESLNNEALRVMHLMPAWIPGKVDGVPAKVEFNMPIKFTLADSGPNIFKRKRRR
ncbi:MAG: TonB family protein [Bacteroidales bacterium]|nr:TonB family protein [Bacteroidales bacterium]